MLCIQQEKIIFVLILFIGTLASGCASQQNVKPSEAEGKCVYGCSNNTLKTGDIKLDNKVSSPKSPPTDPNSYVSSKPDPQVPGYYSDYTLGPEDVIDVSVWKNENLSKTVLVRPDGKISLPLIGDVQAAGLTTSQLRDSIKQLLREYKENPEISIIIKEINSLSVYVIGEVIKPGKLMLRTETSLLQAITLSGGFTQFASTNNIVLLRRIGGTEIRKTIRYKDIVSGKRPEDNLVLQRGDTIIVP